MNIIDENIYPNLKKLSLEVLKTWPEHERYLRISLEGRDAKLLQYSEKLSAIILTLAATKYGEVAGLATDYRFLCEQIVFPEELYFRRNGRYRLQKFEEAFRTVYADKNFMTRYMNGLLVSDALWVNHCRGLEHYVDTFLKGLKPNAELLEIGPGHGLLLYLACENLTGGTISAWDVSEASLDMSRHTLDVLGTKRSVKFETKNIFDAGIMNPENAGRFDAIVLSEVLEHLEEPEQAVRVLLHLCRSGGRVWINVPANSPAPDHLYLVTEPAQAEQLVRNVGFNIIGTAHYPMTGATLERAIKQKLTITCIIVGERPVA